MLPRERAMLSQMNQPFRGSAEPPRPLSYAPTDNALSHPVTLAALLLGFMCVLLVTASLDHVGRSVFLCAGDASTPAYCRFTFDSRWRHREVRILVADIEDVTVVPGTRKAYPIAVRISTSSAAIDVEPPSGALAADNLARQIEGMRAARSSATVGPYVTEEGWPFAPALGGLALLADVLLFGLLWCHWRATYGLAVNLEAGIVEVSRYVGARRVLRRSIAMDRAIGLTYEERTAKPTDDLRGIASLYKEHRVTLDLPTRRAPLVAWHPADAELRGVADLLAEQSELLIRYVDAPFPVHGASEILTMVPVAGLLLLTTVSTLRSARHGPPGETKAPAADPVVAEAERGCTSGSMLHCVNLGIDYETGKGVVMDKARAATLYDRACTGGASAGCANLGQLVLKGEGVPKDAGRAVNLFERACDGREMVACLDLASLYEKGVEVAEDGARARAFYEKACDGGKTSACSKAKRLPGQVR